MTVYWKQNGVWRNSTKTPVPPRKWTNDDFDITTSDQFYPRYSATHKIKAGIRKYFVVGDSFEVVMYGVWNGGKGKFTSTPIPGLRIDPRDKGSTTLRGTILPDAISIKDAMSIVSYTRDPIEEQGEYVVDQIFTTLNGQHIPILEG